jgi:hypothetical protein
LNPANYEEHAKIVPMTHASSTQLIENEDYYIDENGNLVFTEAYHLKRGYCCKNGCKHCPYDFKKGQYE